MLLHDSEDDFLDVNAVKKITVFPYIVSAETILF